jgi:hypothetical protein
VKNLIHALFTSKRFALTLIAALVWVGGRLGLDIDAETLEPLVYALIGLVLSLGMTGWGKEATLIAADPESSAWQPRSDSEG